MNMSDNRLNEYKHRNLYKSNKKRTWFYIGTVFLIGTLSRTEFNSKTFWYMMTITLTLFVIGGLIVYALNRED